jgi:hypothetical protein
MTPSPSSLSSQAGTTSSPSITSKAVRTDLESTLTVCERQPTLGVVEEGPRSSSSKEAIPKDEVRSTVSKASNSRHRQHAIVQRPVDRWTILPNLQNPKTYRRRDKAGIVFVVALASFTGPYVDYSIRLRNTMAELT